MEYKLSDLFALQMGKTPARDEPRYWQNGRHSWISIADLSSVDKFIEETKESISDCAVKESNISMIPEGTVVMSFKLSLGKVAITKKAMYSNEAIMAFIPRAGVDISTDYLYYLLKARRWDTGGNKAVKGITLNKATLSSVKVCIHPAEEQRLIVNILDKLKSVIKRRQSQLAKLDELVKCRFVELFGDPILNEKKWMTKPVKELTTKVGSGATPKGGDSSYKDSGISLIRSLNVHNNIFTTKELAHIDNEQAKQLSNVTIQSGDVLLNITGASVARCCIVPDDILPARVNQHVCIIRCNDMLNPLFLERLLTSDNYQTYLWNVAEGGGGTRQALTKQQIENFSIITPPITLQTTFVSFVQRIDKLRFVVETSHNHKYFTICGLAYLYANLRLNLKFA